MAADADRPVWEGTLRYPPVLGLEPAADGGSRRARLANTVLTADGESITVVFRGDRAEVAERLLVRGSMLRMVGAWDDSRAELLVDRFDVEGIVEEHRYRLAGPPVGEVAAEVDVAALYDTGDPTLGEWPEGPPPSPSEEFATQTPASPPSPPVERPQAPDGVRAPAGFAPGQRVVARDRGNVGTVVSADSGSGQVLVRFTGRNGTTAVIAFAPDQLVPHRRPLSPPGDASRRSAAIVEGGPAPAGPPPDRRPANGQDSAAQSARSSTDSNPRPTPSAQRRTAAASDPVGDTEPGAGKRAPMTAIGVLRVHTRRPEPTGEILL